MIYKKTWLSYFLWAAYTCLTGVMLANYAILFWQKKINAVINYGTALFVVLMCGGVAAIYFRFDIPCIFISSEHKFSCGNIVLSAGDGKSGTVRGIDGARRILSVYDVSVFYIVFSWK